MENVIANLPTSEQPIPEQINQYFDELRQTGDKYVDKLVSETLFPNKKLWKEGRRGYNHLLDIADVLAETPALVLNSNTTVSRQLAEYPEGIRDYYDPIPAPDWVDEEKIALASKLWQQDMLSIITVLYGTSLPACYLMKNGIPALYDTAKLRSRDYIYQRIYETGTMLDDILSPDGLMLINDIDQQSESHIIDSLNSSDPHGEWVVDGNTIRRCASGEPTLDEQNLEKHLAGRKIAANKAKRYLWGKGYIAAKKVRFLHASMRHMLLNPAAMAPLNKEASHFGEAIRQIREPYNAKGLGIPVNQEDQAYTLLTFAYCIPKGLEKLGRYWTDEEKEAFLHAWKAVGYVLGIQENLMTDNWQEAEKLYEFIQRRQVGESEQAKALTETIIYFFQDYFPEHFDLSRGLATRMIVDQIGETQAKLIIPDSYLQEASRLPTRLVFGLGMKSLWLYFRGRHLAYKVPYISTFFRSIFHETGIELINSWRGAYSRKPFYIPEKVNEWRRETGVNKPYLKKLRAWRHRVFNTMAAGLGCIIFSGISLLFYLLFLMFASQGMASFTGWLSLISALAGVFILQHNLSKVSKHRPEPSVIVDEGVSDEAVDKTAAEVSHTREA